MNVIFLRFYTFNSSNPLVKDFYEEETVYVKESTIPFAGEGKSKTMVQISGFKLKLSIQKKVYLLKEILRLEN